MSKQDYNQALEDVAKILGEMEDYPLPLDSWSEGYKDALSTMRIRLNALKEKHNVKR